MDYNLVGLKNNHCFLDDVIILSRGSKEDYLSLVYQYLKKNDENKFRINLHKYHFAKTETESLGYKFGQSGIA